MSSLEQRINSDIMKKITQQDVAKLAKVSTGTVSRVINAHPLVSRKAKEAVLEAIESLGYAPNTVAQSLAQGRTRNILVAFLDNSPILPSTWQYELPILQAINDYSRLHGYSVTISMNPTNDTFNSSQFKDIIRNRSMDGLIILTSLELEKGFLEALYESKIPTVFIGNGPYYHDSQQVGTAILFDNSSTIKEAYNLLRSLGHEYIGFITGTDNHIHSNLRLKAFTDMAVNHCTYPIDDYIFHGDYAVNSGFQALFTFYKKNPPPTAIICANDLMAIGAMRAAKEFHLRVPQDVSVIGFDNIEVANFYSPPLTSVKVPSYELGKIGAEKLVNLIHGEGLFETITLPTELIVRKSVSTTRKE